MRRRIGAWVLSLMLGMGCGYAGAALAEALADDATPIAPTAEVDVLKVENLRMRRALLRQQVADLQRQVQEAGAKLEADQKALEGQLRASLKPPAEWAFDWERGAFVPPVPKTQ